ncbi:MAG: class I SAM-dependent methyltransferase [Bacteroidales bacterium]|jgi:SAM-dependent methyltransferase|nr:class I SAM-dependent methyltransferase [Bacteroidales bacterium]
MKNNDVYGKGLLAYLNGSRNASFIVESDIADTEQWPVKLFFRTFEEMPETEKLALRHAKGRILDVGAGAGSHALWLQENNLDTTAIDISTGAVEAMKKRGVKHALQEDFFNLKNEKFDIILLLMNGVGIVGKMSNLPHFFEQAAKLLAPQGKILLDSSDILYLFEEKDGSVNINLAGKYYGELKYTFSFQNEKGETFDWLFIDFDTLSCYAEKHGFSCKKLFEDDHYLYLAELAVKS